jgi:hypothetical protein
LYDWDRKLDKPKKEKRYIIDASDPEKSSMARYVNAAIYEDEFNTCFLQFRKDVYLRARRDIKPNEELLTSYGKETYQIIDRLDLEPEKTPPRKRYTKQTARKSTTIPSFTRGVSPSKTSSLAVGLSNSEESSDKKKSSSQTLSVITRKNVPKSKRRIILSNSEESVDKKEPNAKTIYSLFKKPVKRRLAPPTNSW